MAGPIIVWLRRDLRLADHPALHAAAGNAVVLVHVQDPDEPRPPGSAGNWWLHQSLAALGQAVANEGGRLLLLKGRAEDELCRLAAAIGAGAVHWNRRFEPGEPERESRLAEKLRTQGVAARDFPADLLFEPGQVLSREGRPFQVFTPFWRTALTLADPARPLPAPHALPIPEGLPDGVTLEALGLMPRLDWWQGMAASWTPGEEDAHARLADFLDNGLEHYSQRRDLPGTDGTSALSPHLAFGEISPRVIWHAVRARMASVGAETFLKELGWREFSHHLLARHPHMAERPLRPEFTHFPWRHDDAALDAWKIGRTGYPVVDAGMRQLWHVGWMHNRVRMIVGSFLIKDLLLPWQKGERWFWDTLVDCSWAANSASWQWVAGCGCDAAPFFRVFNPILQGEKFDPLGHYVRRWVPELAALPDKFIHRPWEAPPLILAEARVRLGETYPLPMVDHDSARKRALAAFQGLRG